MIILKKETGKLIDKKYLGIIHWIGRSIDSIPDEITQRLCKILISKIIKKFENNR